METAAASRVTPLRKREPEQIRVALHNTEAEQALLGAIFRNNLAHGRVSDFLEPEHFGNAVHVRIYAAIGKLVGRGQIANPVTLKNLFDQDGALAKIGGAQYLTRLAESAVTIINAEDYGRRILDLAQRRAIITECEDAAAAAYACDLDESAETIAAHHEQRIADIQRIGRTCPVISATPYVWTDPSNLPTRKFLYGRHTIRGHVTSTNAASGIGKSSLIRTEVLAMVTGRCLLGDHPAGELRVWLVNLEDPIDELRRGIAAAARHFGIGQADIGDRLFLDSGRDTEMVLATARRGGVQIMMPVVKAIIAEIKKNQIDVMIVDPFVHSHAVVENDNQQIATVVKQWANIAEACNCGVELVHHARKAGIGAQVTVEDSRGASAMVAAVRSARVLNVMSREEAERVGIDNPRSYFSVINGKSNLAPPPDKTVWRRLVPVPLDNGPLGVGGDFVGVVEAWAWPDPFGAISPTDMKAVQLRIADGDWRADHRSDKWAGKAVAEVLGIDLSDASVRASVRSLLKAWLSIGALRQVKRLDQGRRLRSFVEVAKPLP